MKFSIYRYNPETDAKPSMQDYKLDDIQPGTHVAGGIITYQG